MSDQDTEQEPSIEEILSSIRQIISDDEDGDDSSQDFKADPISEPEPEPAFEPESVDTEDDIIELTDKIDEEPEPEPEPVIQVDMREAEEEIDVFSAPEAESNPKPEPEPMQKSSKPDVAAPDDSIFTRTAEAAAMSGFAELARKTAVEHNGITLEEIVRTELKPMLREWLDSNLPPIIERLVKEELERVSKRVLED